MAAVEQLSRQAAAVLQAQQRDLGVMARSPPTVVRWPEAGKSFALWSSMVCPAGNLTTEFLPAGAFTTPCVGKEAFPACVLPVLGLIRGAEEMSERHEAEHLGITREA